MPRPSRPVPRAGARARIAHFGGGFETGIVLAVREQGRRLQVRGEGGEVHEFVLSLATARFVSAESAYGPRLELLTDPASGPGDQSSEEKRDGGAWHGCGRAED